MANFLSRLFGGGSGTPANTEDKGGSVLSWARTAKPGCELAPAAAPDDLQLATFAGGCFWGLELAYQRVPGVVRTSVGYTGGHDPAPNYNSVCSGSTGHAEAVQVTYDPREVSYERLLSEFFQRVDPTTRNRQGGDVGSQYRSALYHHSPEQQAAAKKAFAEASEQLAQGTFRPVRGRSLVTELAPAGDYYLAEKYHQQYLAKGGRFGMAQSADKGATDKIRCYG
ncbi:hypothetical protein WJX81_003596 [Elliptochloris bilobata]|uniref:peptide-methionine (S)-S-oxide reductase n=1 Tax=Elliptochloris bilobata TaxID=381761 RepID=A0AAW1SHL4_9CHLO